MLPTSTSARRGASLLAALALALSLLGLAAPASAIGAPGGLAPKSTAVAANPVLKWKPVRGAARYSVQVSQNKSFSSLLFYADTTNIYAVPTSQLPTGKIWWRVRSVNSRGTASRWTLASFNRRAPGGPGLMSPASGATLTQPAHPPLLRWRAVSGARTYEVEIDTVEHDWVETKTYTTSTTSLVVPDPQQPGTYWWRVRAKLDGDIVTRPSSARSYIVGALPVVRDASLVDDDPADAHVEDVVFDWDPVPGAVSYDIRVSSDDSFNTIIDSRAVKGTRYSPTTTYDNTNYWWQVRSRDIFGQAADWDTVPIRTFQRAWLDTAKLEWPQDRTTVGDDFYFQWTPVEKAARYRIDLGTDPNFSPYTYSTCYTTQTTYTPGFAQSPGPDYCMPQPGVTYYWRVQALDDPKRVNGVISAVNAFVYDPDNDKSDPGTVTQLQPADGASVDVPTLTWKPVEDAVKYQVRLTQVGGGTRTATTYSYSWTPTGSPLTKGATYTWTVQSVDKNGHVSVLPNSQRKFTVSGNLPAGSALVPTSVTQPSARFPSLSWGAYPEATHYRIKVADHGFNFFTDLNLNFAYPAGTDESDRYLRPGTYDYYVEAWKGSTKLADGTVRGTFTISDLATPTGHRIAMDGLGLDGGTVCAKSLASGGICEDTRATPVLDWQSVPDAGYYLIYLSYDKQLTNLVYGNKADPKTLPITQNTRWTPTEALKESQAGGAYYWYVRPCKTPTSCGPDPTEAAHAFRKRSNPVELLGPSNGAVVANDITFTWTDFLQTNQKSTRTNPETNEKVSQSARGYRIEVADNPAFTRPLDTMVVDQKTYTAFNNTYPEGTLYWRVQAIDGSNNGLAWSEARKFVKRSPRPSLTFPANDSTVAGTPPFSWKPLDFAAGYEVVVYKNGDKNASPGNLVIRGLSKQTSYSHYYALPASGRNYVWRVRRSDADGRLGAWSAWRSFKVTGAAPRLVSPKAGGAVNKARALVKWRAAKGAVFYRVEMQKGGTLRYAVTTYATAWAPNTVLDRGKWQWRVIAYDTTGQPTRSSAWRGFSAR